MNKLYKSFQTDNEVEKRGIILDYPGCRIRIARAGGANANYAKVLERLTRPYKRAIANETLDREISEKIMREAYAQAVIIDWETQVDGEWRSGIEFEDGTIQPVTIDNLVKVFTDLPDLFKDITTQSNSMALFLKNIDLEDAKN